MTINEVIMRVDELRPNAYGDEAKTAWLSELDGKLCREVLGREAVSYSFPENQNDTLLVEAPYDNMYEHYLYAMIDYSNREIQAYMNSMTFFNQAYSEFRKAYIRENMPESAGEIKNL